MTVRGFRDSFRSYTPGWLQNRQDVVTGALKNVGYRMLYAMIFPLDIAVQSMVEGLKAAWPGVGTPTALPLIAQSRALLQGELESAAAFSARCINWLIMWEQSDSYATEQLARNIQAYLGNTPRVTVIDRVGHRMVVSGATDPGGAGVASLTTAPFWNWDGTSNPERAGMWSDMWIIIYPCEWAAAAPVGTRVQDHSDGYGLGHMVQRTAVDAILSLVSLIKGNHMSVRAIVFSYDGTFGDPSGASNPDGNWGYSSKLSGGTRVPARTSNVRCWVRPDL